MAIIDSISPKKMGVNFFSAKLDTKGGGGSEGFVSKNTHKNIFFFKYFPKAANLNEFFSSARTSYNTFVRLSAKNCHTKNHQRTNATHMMGDARKKIISTDFLNTYKASKN